jgi:type IX secretion system PorP/SprF family membrane protein
MQKINNILPIALLLCASQVAMAQGLHFSQFNNAPSLINPSSTGQLIDDNFRVGVNYRNQNELVPVPYNTYSAFGDFTLGKKKRETNWFGIGFSAFNDDAGGANLRLTQMQTSLAYHVTTSDKTMWSLGASAAHITRSINLDKLTFIEQWDEFSFNNDLPNRENPQQGKLSYMDIGGGATFSYYTNQTTLITVGLGAAHINMPAETFLGVKNRLGIRPNLTVNGVFKISKNSMFEPSIYYTSQKKASQLVTGAFWRINMNRGSMYYNLDGASHLLIGTYVRLNDAIIPTVGYKYKDYTLNMSYDFTTSRLSVANSRAGALEFSLIWRGMYGSSAERSNAYGCPRF